MKRLGLFLFALASPSTFAIASSENESVPRSLPLMSCIATHDETDLEFYGEGLKWVGAHQAIKACEEWAEQQGKSGNLCRIKSCEPMFEN